MNITIRTTIVTLVASAGLIATTVAPAVSQAQWHNYCTAGHCITHSNFTIGGVSPCVALNASDSKANEAVLEAIQNKKEQADKVHPEMTQEEAQAQIEEAEAQAHLASIAAFEWGCDIAAKPSKASKSSVASKVSSSVAAR